MPDIANKPKLNRALHYFITPKTTQPTKKIPSLRARGAPKDRTGIEVRWPKNKPRTSVLSADITENAEFERNGSAKHQPNTQDTQGNLWPTSIACQGILYDCVPSFHLAARTPPQTQHPMPGPTYTQEGLGIIGRDWTRLEFDQLHHKI